MTERPAEVAPEPASALVVRPLPDEFVRWQLEARLATLDRIARGEHIPMFGAHLPVLVSHDPEGRFPAQTANKGVGFLPSDEWLAHYTNLFRDVLARSAGRPAETSRAERILAIRLLYEHPERLDLRRLGLLEIFEGATFRNLRRDARATLHYTDSGPEYRSFQLNGCVAIAGPGDARYDLIVAARHLFEVEAFHIQQPAYPWAYVFSVVEVYDKTPRHGRAGTLVPGPVATLDAPAPVTPAVADPPAGDEPARDATSLAQLPVAIRDVLVGIDNSRYSRWCRDTAIRIGAAFGPTLVGAHVYAARLHDQRFRDMEAGLPERYHKPGVLERQRDIHDSLITTGLELISDSYLATLEGPARDAGLRWRGKRMEGRHHAELLRDIAAERYDLVVLGARGLGEDPAGTVAPLGSVTERVLRGSRSDMLIVKDDRPLERRIVVAIDGSPASFGALRTAVALAARLGGRVEAVAVVDPDFHRRAFRGLAGVLSEEAGRRFRFRDQERLHEEIIDAGIARIYRDHLALARTIAARGGLEIATTLLEGKAYPAICAHLARVEATLLAVGRAGSHASSPHEIGSNAENLARLAPCHVLVSARRFDPVVGGTRAAAASSAAEPGNGHHGLRWSAEALAGLERIPSAVRSFAMSAIETLARERGMDEVTPEVMREARERSGMP
ncbi:MAG: universal stress protein [Chloroflexi bacterium]|nr:universal stress protein [Chloroflexota bacterium]